MYISNSYSPVILSKLKIEIIKYTKNSNMLTNRNLEEVEKWLKNNYVYYAIHQNEILGFMVREPLGDMNNKLVELKCLYIKESHRNNGLATKLISTTISFLGFDYICATKYTLVHGILTKLGFKQINIFDLSFKSLITYLFTRKLTSILNFFKNKSHFWYLSND